MIFYILFFILHFVMVYASEEPNFESNNYYEILGVSEKATRDEIKKRYNQLSVKYHPDKTQDDKDAEEKFKKIAIAWNILSDQTKRAKYDIKQIYKSPLLGLEGIVRLFRLKSVNFYSSFKSHLLSKSLSLWQKLYLKNIKYWKKSSQRKSYKNFYLK